MKRGEWCLAHGWQWIKLDREDIRAHLEFVGHVRVVVEGDSDLPRFEYHPLAFTPATEADIRAEDEAIRAAEAPGDA